MNAYRLTPGMLKDQPSPEGPSPLSVRRSGSKVSPIPDKAPQPDGNVITCSDVPVLLLIAVIPASISVIKTIGLDEELLVPKSLNALERLMSSSINRLWEIAIATCSTMRLVYRRRPCI